MTECLNLASSCVRGNISSDIRSDKDQKEYPSFEAYISDYCAHEIYLAAVSFLTDQKNQSTVVPREITYLNDLYILSTEVMKVSGVRRKDSWISLKIDVRVKYFLKGVNPDLQEVTGSRSCWMTIDMKGMLFEGLSFLSVTNVGHYRKESAGEIRFSRLLVPYISERGMEQTAVHFLQHYAPEALSHPERIRLPQLLSSMGLEQYYALLSDGVDAEVFFSEATAPILDCQTGRIEKKKVRPGTILVSTRFRKEKESVREEDSVIKACIHWEFHRMFFELQQLLGHKEYDRYLIYSPEAAQRETEKRDRKLPDQTAEAFRWMDWQAEMLSSRIRMPAPAIAKLVMDTMKISPGAEIEDRIPVMLRKLMLVYGVSEEMAAKRIEDAGKE